ncbi:transposase [Pseudomonas sp. IT-P44]
MGQRRTGSTRRTGGVAAKRRVSKDIRVTIVVVKWAVRAIKHWHWPTGLLPVVGAILIGEAFTQLSLMKALTGCATGRRTGAGSQTVLRPSRASPLPH